MFRFYYPRRLWFNTSCKHLRIKGGGVQELSCPSLGIRSLPEMNLATPPAPPHPLKTIPLKDQKITITSSEIYAPPHPTKILYYSVYGPPCKFKGIYLRYNTHLMRYTHKGIYLRYNTPLMRYIHKGIYLRYTYNTPLMRYTHKGIYPQRMRPQGRL